MKKILKGKNQALSAKVPYKQRFLKDMRLNWKLYLLVLPVILHYLIFLYGPMYGAIIAFKDYSPIKGIMGSDWVGLKHFADFFTSRDFWEILFNTLNISITTLVFSFPAPIILALMINEIKNMRWKKAVQTITYMPHFVSLVVICGILRTFISDTGVVTTLLNGLGIVPKTDLLSVKEYFIPIYVISGIWQEIGWGSIIYLSALTAVDQQLYEAASIDGAGRIRQLFTVTLPAIAPTITVMFILRLGSLMTVGFEKIILLYNPLTYDVADVISSYVYRRGLQEFNYSYSTAVGLFNSVINMILLITANAINKKINDSSLW